MSGTHLAAQFARIGDGMSSRILMVTDDATHRHLLLESQGHEVVVTSADDASILLRQKDFDLALVTASLDENDVLSLCDRMKQMRPGMLVGLMAMETQEVPRHHSVDAVIRDQQRPALFLAAVQTLLQSANGRARSATLG
jgi:DNA-binding response OmpR family regulator